MTSIPDSDSSEHRFRDRLAFEGPWLRAALAALVIILLGIFTPFSWLGGASLSATSLLAVCIAIGLKPDRKLIRPLLMAVVLAALAGALLPSLAVKSLWVLAAVLLLGLIALLRINHPYSATRIRPQQDYSFAGQAYTLPRLTYRSSRIFFVREDIQRQLMETAAFADRFLARQGIRYVICYGTLLGALRHGGPHAVGRRHRLHHLPSR